MTADEYEEVYRVPLTSLQTKLMQLDAALTGHAKAAEHAARQKRFDHERLMGDLYYLSDGGYSRLAYSFQDRRLFLTSNSIEPTRSNWDRCASLVQDVEADMTSWLESQGY